MIMLLRIWRAVWYRVEHIAKIFGVRAGYSLVRAQIRRRGRDKKIRVLFLVNETTKWKTQSLFKLMQASPGFEPVVALAFADFDFKLSEADRRAKYEANRRYFQDLGDEVVDAYSFERNAALSLDRYSPDVVFYQHPWGWANVQQPHMVSRFALTCYVPYFVANYGNLLMDYLQEFHRELWCYVVINEAWASLYRKVAWPWNYAGRVLGLGHTFLDYYYLHREEAAEGNVVIYAPHWSIDCEGNENLENYSTFLWTGKAILEYARQHQEFSWVYKPHPTLLATLRRTKVWSDTEIDDYWKGWEEVGTLCTTGEYLDLFVRSKALITDCASFLTEYFVTGKPLIHLISPTHKIEPLPPFEQNFKSFYRVHDLDELQASLQLILERGEDPMREQRQSALKAAHLSGTYAAKNILDFLCRQLNVKGVDA